MVLKSNPFVTKMNTSKSLPLSGIRVVEFKSNSLPPQVSGLAPFVIKIDF